MIGALPVVVVALPFISALALALVGSWRFGTWINAGSASLLFLLACLLPWRLNTGPPLLHIGVAEAHLALLTSFAAMTTAWFSRGYTQTALAARSLDRRSARRHHVGCQALIGAILLALLSDSPHLTWIALAIAVVAATAVTGAVRTSAAAAAASRLLLLCGVGMTLALFGTLLLYLAVEPHVDVLRWSMLRTLPHHAATLQIACIFLVLGYGALAGMVPLHSWMSDASAEGAGPGAIMVGTLMVNAPLLVFMRLRSAVGLDPGLSGAVLIVLGLATLLLGAVCLFRDSNLRRTVAFAGMAQIGMIIFAIGVGGPVAIFAALLHMTLLVLVRASVLQCDGLAPTKFSDSTCIAGVLALALLPMFALFLIVRAAVDQSAWLLLPLVVGVLLTSMALLARLPTPTSPATALRGTRLPAIATLAPVWLQLGLVVMLALAMPGPVVAWFTAVVAAR